MGAILSSCVTRDMVAQLVTDQYAKLPIEPAFLRHVLPCAFDGMRRLSEDPAASALFPWRASRADAYGAHYLQEVGFQRNRLDDENKAVFQFAIAESPEIGVYRDFLEALIKLEARAREISLCVAACLDTYFTKAHISYQEGSTHSRLLDAAYITRVLRYFPAASIGARPHCDRSFLTVHWGATHAGLHVFDTRGKPRAVDSDPDNNILIMLGRKYAAARQDRRLGCPHGVYRTMDGDRYSIVTFVHSVPLLSDAHWLQENDACMKARERSLL